MSNTVKKHEGSAADKIIVCSAESYKDKEDKLKSAKYSPVTVEHGSNDIVVNVVFYDITRDNSGKIVARTDSKKRDNEELTH